MKRILIHTEIITKSEQKVMFQIKLPKRITAVTGVLIEASLISNFGGTPANRHCGQLTLSVPDQRDVFYADDVFFSDQVITNYNAIKVQGISADSTWTKRGTKRDFFGVSVPINRTIIEGFYEDQRGRSKQTYKINIYLKMA